MLESRVLRPGRPDHCLYLGTLLSDKEHNEQVESLREAMFPVTLGALSRRAISYEAADSFIREGLREVAPKLLIIPGEHIPTATRVFERDEYHRNRQESYAATGFLGLIRVSTLSLYYPQQKIAEATKALSHTPVTLVHEWINAEGYVAKPDPQGNLVTLACPYDLAKDRKDHELDKRPAWQWQKRVQYVDEHGITHLAVHYDELVDNPEDIAPWLTQTSWPPAQTVQLGWLREGAFVPAPPPADPFVHP